MIRIVEGVKKVKKPQKFSLRLFGGGVAALAAAALMVAVGVLLVLGAGSAVAAPVGTITQFSAGLNPGATPRWLVLGPDGNLWFTDSIPQRAIGRITPSGAIAQFTAGLSIFGNPQDLVAGPNGNVWFVDAGNPGGIGRITPAGAITVFSEGPSQDDLPWSLVVGSDGNLWFTEAGAIWRITTSEPPAQAPPTTSTPTTTATPSTASVSLAGSRITTSRGHATLKLRCTGTGTCGGKLTLSAKQIVKKHGRKTSHTVTIGTGRFSILTGKTASVTIHLNACGRTLLKTGHGRLTARLAIEETSGETQARTVHLIEKSSHAHKKPGK
jgi:streptogramin lyase